MSRKTNDGLRSVKGLKKDEDTEARQRGQRFITAVCVSIGSMLLLGSLLCLTQAYSAEPTTTPMGDYALGLLTSLGWFLLFPGLFFTGLGLLRVLGLSPP